MTRVAPLSNKRWLAPRVRAGVAGIGLLAMAAAQAGLSAALPPSPGELAATTQPVRVLCLAASAEVFLRDPDFRDRVLTRLVSGDEGATPSTTVLRARVLDIGGQAAVPLGSGFVVDAQRQHVMGSWHAVSACVGDGSGRRQVAVLEAATPAQPVPAQVLPDRSFLDASGQPVKLVQALCHDHRNPCSVDLPRAADQPPPAEADRRRQLANLLAYAPDLAVLRVPQALRSAPMALALQQPVDDQMRLVIRTAEAPAAPGSLVAVYTGPQQLSQLPPGGAAGDEVHARLHRMAAKAPQGQAGAAVLRGDGVVGVLSALQPWPGSSAGAAGSQTLYAVPVAVAAAFLDLLHVPYVTHVPQVSVPSVRPPPPDAGPADGGRWWSRRQQWLLAGAALLALAAAAAFFVLVRRGRGSSEGPSTLPLPHRLQPGNATLLHAVGAVAVSPPDAAPALPERPLAETAIAPLQGLAPPPPGARLHCSEGPLAGSVYSLPMPNGGTTVFVGRDPQTCQIVLPPYCDTLSAVHACFSWDAATRHLTVRDLSSSGTWVNGERVSKGRTLPLAGQDTVDLGGPGEHRFTIELPGDRRQRPEAIGGAP